jgi:hypothetical protein
LEIPMSSPQMTRMFGCESGMHNPFLELLWPPGRLDP